MECVEYTGTIIIIMRSRRERGNLFYKLLSIDRINRMLIAPVGFYFGHILVTDFAVGVVDDVLMMYAINSGFDSAYTILIVVTSYRLISLQQMM